MLDVIGAAPGSQNTIDWPQVWRESPGKARIKLQLAEMKNELLSKPVNDTPDSLKEYAASFTDQFYVVTKRIFEQYWRTPSYLYSKTLLCAGSVSHSPAAFYKNMC
jgi:ATP-binding cassette subfamily G (WHITE) protein 2 (PDR)